MPVWCIFPQVIILHPDMYHTHHEQRIKTLTLNVRCSWWGGLQCICFVRREQMDTAAVVCVTCRSVTRVCHGAWEPKRSRVIPPLSGPSITLNGRHLPPPQPHSSLEILLPKDPGAEWEGYLLQIWPPQAPTEVGLLWPLLQAGLAVCLWDKRRWGVGVWCGWWVETQIIYAGNLVDWFISLRFWMLPLTQRKCLVLVKVVWVRRPASKLFSNNTSVGTGTFTSFLPLAHK